MGKDQLSHKIRPIRIAHKFFQSPQFEKMRYPMTKSNLNNSSLQIQPKVLDGKLKPKDVVSFTHKSTGNK